MTTPSTSTQGVYMFLNGLSKSWSTTRGQQQAEGAFLVLMSAVFPGVDSKAVRGLVRRVKLHQSGHFMVGVVRVRSQSGQLHAIPLSGAYGADGLIRLVPNAIYALGVDLPDELREAWNKGEGHNSAGSEAPLMDAWAKTLVWPASTYGADRQRKRG